MALPFTIVTATEPEATTVSVAVTPVPVIAVQRGARRERLDELAVEEPLAIAIVHGPLGNRSRTTISVTMRTPGDDLELAAGLLLAGRSGHADGAASPGRGGGANEFAVFAWELHPQVKVDLTGDLSRRGYTSSACGVCGKTSIEAVEAACEGPRPGGARVPVTVIHTLPDRLRASQETFARTGGLHAAALFDHRGNLLAVREDVGRHNAVDKLLGAEFLAGRLPLDERILVVSGRAGFELIQKAAVAGVPIFAAVGAPSSLAVGLAERLGVTLIGFMRDRPLQHLCRAAEQYALDV